MNERYRPCSECGCATRGEATCECCAVGARVDRLAAEHDRVTGKRPLERKATDADLIARALETVERATPDAWTPCLDEPEDEAAKALLGTIGPHLLAVAAAVVALDEIVRITDGCDPEPILGHADHVRDKNRRLLAALREYFPEES